MESIQSWSKQNHSDHDHTELDRWHFSSDKMLDDRTPLSSPEGLVEHPCLTSSAELQDIPEDPDLK